MPLILKGYRVLSLNPPLIRVCSVLIVLPGNTGTGNETSKTKLKGLFNSSVTFKVTIGSVDIFFNIISTFGPPGFTKARSKKRLRSVADW